MKTAQCCLKHRIVCAIFIVALILHLYLRSYSYAVHMSRAFGFPQFVKSWWNSATSSGGENSFLYYWMRSHQARVDWEIMLRPCVDKIAWGSVQRGWMRQARSSASKSYISYMDIKPSGQFSRIFIQTRTAKGKTKSFGGDFWRVFFRGPASLSATVFDHQNGTYEALALFLEPGNYMVEAYLDYSLCDGLKDPPESWFRIGNAQGRYQPDGILGSLDEFLHEPLLGGENITIEIEYGGNLSSIDNLPSLNCTKSCPALWDGHGRWKDGVWLPFVSANKKRRRGITEAQGTLWIFGDSLAVRLHNHLATQPLCSAVFVSCRRSYNWIYPVAGGKDILAKLRDDNFDFRAELVLNTIRNVLRHDDMKSNDSLLILNLGLHFAFSVNFTTFQKLIDDVIMILANRTKELGSEAKVVWKTSTAMFKEHVKPPRNVTHARFFTEQRVRLFDAYAMTAMCNVGIEVLDVFPMTASYPPGPTDIVHFTDDVFSAAEMEIERYATEGNEGDNMEVCMR